MTDKKETQEDVNPFDRMFTIMLTMIVAAFAISFIGAIIFFFGFGSSTQDDELNQKLTQNFKDEGKIVAEHLITDIVIDCSQKRIKLSFVHLDNKVTKTLHVNKSTYSSFCAENSRIKFKNDVEYGAIEYLYYNNERRGISEARLHRYELAVTIVNSALSVVIETAEREVAARMTWELELLEEGEHHD